KQFVRRVLASLAMIIVATAGLPMSSGAQTNGPNLDAAIANLAFQIAGPLEKEKVKRVIVADLLDPDGRSHPVGRFLADKLSAVLIKDYPALQTISFSHSLSAIKGVIQDDQAQALQGTRRWAKNLGAKVVITGSFGRVAQGIGLTLMAMKTGSDHKYAQTSGVVPISDEIAAISTEPIAAMKSRIARAGVGGVTVPICVHCPAPNFSEEGRAAKYQGTVVLRVVITTEGVATNIVVVKGPGNGLEEKAIEAVRSWRFRPAVGPDGQPVATMLPIEVTFRLTK
ncbi:MAG TPA: energy transducer TonB, partial [Candidatus Acidoferrum sp.]